MSHGARSREPECAPFPVWRLLSWYRMNCRSLPWRETRDPYRIWLSEIMLQQTQVATVIPYYERFLQRFPTLFDLARATEEDVLQIWENLGYYNRARQLHRAARMVVEKFGGEIPRDFDNLLRLPGIGAYTAGAILSIAFGATVPAIDGNARRVLCRFYALPGVNADPKGYRCLADRVMRILPASQPGCFNQALMELGATLCRSRKPLCDLCPLLEQCLARRRGQTDFFPMPAKKKITPVRTAVAALIRDDRGRVLVVKRPPSGLLGSLWKFPGGFAEREETPFQALKRTVTEEVGLRIIEASFQGTVKHAYTHFRLCLHIFTGKVSPGEAKRTGCADCRWIDPKAIGQLPFSRADRLAGNHLP
ncbi:MAG: A/G-specific adenine glycosylase [Syntrophales bacterium]